MMEEILSAHPLRGGCAASVSSAPRAYAEAIAKRSRPRSREACPLRVRPGPDDGPGPSLSNGLACRGGLIHAWLVPDRHFRTALPLMDLALYPRPAAGIPVVLEASPSLVYGARLLSGFRLIPDPGFKSRSLRHRSVIVVSAAQPCCRVPVALPKGRDT